MSKRTRGFFRRICRRITDGLDGLDNATRERHAAFLRSRQTEEGGFAGRAGEADLYYTGFAVQALAALRRLEADVAIPCTVFLIGHRPQMIVDQVQWLHAAMLLADAAPGAAVPLPTAEELAGLLEPFRSLDGGYGKRRGASSGSTYWSYLAALCYDAVGARPPQVRRLRWFLRSRRCPDGGFSETGRAAAGSTNATAAGVALAALGGWAALSMVPPALRFLATMQGPGGGFRAGARVPADDLLSTFTVSVALLEARAAGKADLAAAAAFAAACEAPGGGYRAAPWLDAVDVEYTYYGLGCRALLGTAPAGGETAK
jgi:geranylgeranyl transferase type-2 subunit beta